MDEHKVEVMRQVVEGKQRIKNLWLQFAHFFTDIP